jgi:transcriptional regulator with XRE-family HTH domain
VSQIEGSKRAGTAATLKKLARALPVPLDALPP